MSTYIPNYSYGSMLGYIQAGRSKTSRPVANNTHARILEDSRVAVKLHETDVVIISGAGYWELNSGGWLTLTTKDRINKYSPAGITQRNGIWYMRDGSLFYDGIVIDADGIPLKPRKPEAYEKKLATIKKQARAYAKGFVKALEAGLVDYPGAGDCWGCLSGGVIAKDHIAQHIKENYFVPTLLVNAGRAAGYRDEQIGLMGIGGRRIFIDPENVLYKYIVKQLQAGL